MSSESRIWEIRPFGSMRGGSELVIGLWPVNPTASAYSTARSQNDLRTLALGLTAHPMGEKWVSACASHHQPKCFPPFALFACFCQI